MKFMHMSLKTKQHDKIYDMRSVMIQYKTINNNI